MGARQIARLRQRRNAPVILELDLTQGIAEGLGVRGPITSPTFVIARVHPSLVGGPELVHVDAYRLDGALELEDLDLDSDLDAAVTVVEWGAGLAEDLADDRLELLIDVDQATEERRITLLANGSRAHEIVREVTA